MKKKLLFPLFLTIIIVLSGLTAPLPAKAAGTVGNGTPGSCTEAALDTALTGGGLVTFNCGPAPLTITISSQKTITADTTIDGGLLITLDGSISTRLFSVDTGVTLNLYYITLSNGSNVQGGAIRNAGTLNIIDGILVNNQAPGGVGGAIYNDGTLSITNSTFSNNTASAGMAGAINNAGTLTMVASAFTNNFGGLAGGALVNTGSANISYGTFDNNNADTGGAISNNGNLSISRSTFNTNTTISGNGGAIINSGTLTISGSIFSANSTTSGYGGGIFNSTSLTISTSTFSENSTSASQWGGGLFNDSGGTAVIDSSTFISNTVPGGIGGGIYNGGQLSILADTFTGNASGGGLGGGIYSNSTHPLTITNSTFSGNFGGLSGGGALISGPATVLNSTFYNNGAGGLFNGGIDTVSIRNTILASNPSGNCFGPITSLGNNLEDTTVCLLAGPGDLSNTNPLLGPLADNGGPTQTHALLAGSPAINGGNNSGCPAADQRGVRRPLLGTCDIGAYEFGFVISLPLIGK